MPPTTDTTNHAAGDPGADFDDGWASDDAGCTNSSAGSSTAVPALPPGYSTMPSKELGLSLTVTLVLGTVMGVAGVGAVGGLVTNRGWAVAAGLWAIGISSFHFGEFVCVAAYRPRELKAVRFLLPGLGASREYNIAFAVGVAEFVIEGICFPGLKSNLWVSLPAGIVMIGCAVGRIAAMAHCGGNFSHIIEIEHRQKHELVVSGPYAWSRHPAYFFWFWWSIASQVCLGNPICTVGYTAASYFFFRHRIPYEEALLASPEFFGAAYLEYKKRVPTRIPFIP